MTMMLLSVLLTVANLVTPQQVPQATPLPMQPAPATADVLNTGPCLDSPRSVPAVLQLPAVRATQIVRIDKIVATSTLLQGEVIGFLYTLQDGTTWLGERTPDYMSAAGARAINLVLASTHMPSQAISAFPPTMRFGVATHYQEFFRVEIPPTADQGLRIEIDPCVAWPAARQLPDPAM